MYPNDSKLVTICRGVGGIHGDFEATTSSSGTLSTYEQDFDRFLADDGHRIAEGALVVDLAPLYDHDRFVSMVMNCPLVNTRLTEGQVDHLPMIDSIMAIPVANYFGEWGVATAVKDAQAEDDEITGFSQVSPSRWQRYWREQGARCGIYRAGRIEWEGEVV